MCAQRDAGPTVEKSRTVVPSRAARRGEVAIASEVLGQPELAARDDVLLDLRGAASDGVDHRVAVGHLRAAAEGRLLGVDAELRPGPGDVEHRVGDALREARGKELVLGRLD